MFTSLFYALRTPGRPGVTGADARIAAEQAVMSVENRLDHLELACSGLWTLLKEKHGYTDDELIVAIQEVDARDGVVDGKVGRAQHTCPHCHRKLLSRESPKCSWCGGSLEHKAL
jgi:hypothetical protein